MNHQSDTVMTERWEAGGQTAVKVDRLPYSKTPLPRQRGDDQSFTDRRLPGRSARDKRTRQDMQRCSSWTLVTLAMQRATLLLS